ncbi:MAG: hypothetical protein M1819_001930 [Sarea resinae]|nr:MAG: hypothetical protein M1819_001930 [Sarea resinae]
MLARSLWSLCTNITTIESWEMERHRTVVRRAKVLGGYLDGPDGTRVRIVHQEFPYDIGIWKNIKQGMGGTENVLSWIWPFSKTPNIATGLDFEVNGFEDPSLSWPPPDPDRMPRAPRPPTPFTNSSPNDPTAFRTRQRADLHRRRRGQGPGHTQTQNRPLTPPSPIESEIISPGAADIELHQQRNPQFHRRYDTREHDAESEVQSEESGEEGWRNSEGERLADFGVDEEVEFYDWGAGGGGAAAAAGGDRRAEDRPEREKAEADEDDIPLSELLERRRRRRRETDEAMHEGR